MRNRGRPHACAIRLPARTIGIARARVKIDLANLAYNVRRFVWLGGRTTPVEDATGNCPSTRASMAPAEVISGKTQISKRFTHLEMNILPPLRRSGRDGRPPSLLLS